MPHLKLIMLIFHRKVLLQFYCVNCFIKYKRIHTSVACLQSVFDQRVSDRWYCTKYINFKITKITFYMKFKINMLSIFNIKMKLKKLKIPWLYFVLQMCFSLAEFVFVFFNKCYFIFNLLLFKHCSSLFILYFCIVVKIPINKVF